MTNDVVLSSRDEYKHLKEVFENWIETRDLILGARLIEETYKAFGINIHAVEINPSADCIKYRAEVLDKDKLPDVLKRSADIALALSSPTGEIEIKIPPSGKDIAEFYIPRFKSSGHAVSKAECKPINSFKKAIAIWFLRKSRAYYNKAIKVGKNIEYLDNLKQVQKMYSQ